MHYHEPSVTITPLYAHATRRTYTALRLPVRTAADLSVRLRS